MEIMRLSKLCVSIAAGITLCCCGVRQRHRNPVPDSTAFVPSQWTSDSALVKELLKFRGKEWSQDEFLLHTDQAIGSVYYRNFDTVEFLLPARFPNFWATGTLDKFSLESMVTKPMLEISGGLKGFILKLPLVDPAYGYSVPDSLKHLPPIFTSENIDHVFYYGRLSLSEKFDTYLFMVLSQEVDGTYMGATSRNLYLMNVEGRKIISLLDVGGYFYDLLGAPSYQESFRVNDQTFICKLESVGLGDQLYIERIKKRLDRTGEGKNQLVFAVFQIQDDGRVKMLITPDSK